MGRILGFEGLYSSDGSIGGITIVSTATSIQFAVVDLGRPRAQIIAPARKLGLFVQVAVHQYGLCGADLSGGDFKKQHRRAPRQANHFQHQTTDLLGLYPAGGVAHHGVKVAVGFPVRIKHGGLGRDADVVL